MSIIGGKFTSDKNASTEEEQPWNKFLIPDPKSKWLILILDRTNLQISICWEAVWLPGIFEWSAKIQMGGAK